MALTSRAAHGDPNRETIATEAVSSRDGPRRRLLIVNSTLHIGGAEKVAASLATHVSTELFRPMACYLKEPGLIADEMIKSGVPLVPIPGLQFGQRDYLTSLKLRRLIVANHIGIIHTHDTHGMIDGAVCRLTNRHLKFVHTFHFGNYPNRPFRDRLIEHTLWRTADALVAVSHVQADAICSLYGIPRDRLRVIWNGVDKPRPDAACFEREEGIPLIASISTLTAQKGLDHLLKAAGLLRDRGERFMLLVAGEGHLRDPLQRLAAKLGLNGLVRFIGWVPRASDVLLPQCDIFVQSSLWEAMSIVVLEAMACGKPIVLTHVGENPRIVESDVSGILVPPARSEKLADAIQLLLRDKALRERLGRAAQKRYEEYFTVGQMVSAYEALYSGLSLER